MSTGTNAIDRLLVSSRSYLQAFGLPVVLLLAVCVQMVGSPAPTRAEVRADDGGGVCPGRYGQTTDIGLGIPPVVSDARDLRRVTVCSYPAPPVTSPVGGPKTHLHLIAGRSVTDRTEVRSLAWSLNHLRPYVPAHPPPGSRLCPPETAGVFYLRFTYETGAELSVRVFRSGCRRVVAGRSDRWTHLSRGVETRLAKIVSRG